MCGDVFLVGILKATALQPATQIAAANVRSIDMSAQTGWSICIYSTGLHWQSDLTPQPAVVGPTRTTVQVLAKQLYCKQLVGLILCESVPSRSGGTPAIALRRAPINSSIRAAKHPAPEADFSGVVRSVTPDTKSGRGNQPPDQAPA